MDEEIKNVIEVLRKGGVVLYPTDTIWGLGCDATNKDAVQKIYQIKKRAENKAMLVLLGDVEDLTRYVSEVPDVAYSLIELNNKPTTIIYDDAYNLASNLLGENNSVGIRVSNELFSKTLCQRFHKPIVSTSANVSGEVSPATFDEISDYIKESVDYIVKYRQDDKTKNSASCIIKLSNDCTFKILRP